MQISDKDRRLYPRIKTTTVIHIFTSNSDEMSYQGTLDEISDTGFSFTLSAPVEISGRIRIEIPHFVNSEKLKIPGTITWTDASKVHFGGSFSRLSEIQMQALRSVFTELNSETAAKFDRRLEDRRGDVNQIRRELENKNMTLEEIGRQLKSRVAITGIGVISSIGIGVDAIWKSIVDNRSGVKKYPSNNNGDDIVMIAKIDEFDPSKYLDAKRVRRMHRHSQMACAAAVLAMNNADLKSQSEMNERWGIFEGTSIGGIETIFEQHRIYMAKGPEKVNPLVLLSGSLGDSASEISMLLHLNGPSHTICTGSASSADAIGMGMRAIQYGDVDVALVGGSEMPLTPEMIHTFKKMGVLMTASNGSDTLMRPFDSNRSGFALGEGAAFLVLERWDSAVRRNAPIYAELVGYGNSCDAQHASASDPLGRGLALAIGHALKDARMNNSEIDYVNMHGTATLAGDRGETRAMKRAFGKNTQKMFFSSTKPMTGHLLGASGALEAVITILALQHSSLPPTINLENQDPECDLNFMPNKMVIRKINAALSVNSGFGGKNAALIFRALRD